MDPDRAMLSAACANALDAADADADARRRDWRRDAAAATLLLALLATAVAMAAGLGARYVAAAVIGFALALPLIERGLAAHPHPRFGAANRITLLRLALAAGLLAALPHADADRLGWGLVGVATLAALLDAVDGPLARRRGLASAFGARFDMEVDALLILVLALLLVGTGRTGPWVLAAGLLRYGFVAAARPWPWLAAPLPPSRRRQAVCVAQIVALIVALAPIVPAAMASVIAGLGLAALLASFAIDIAWLARSRPSAAPG